MTDDHYDSGDVYVATVTGAVCNCLPDNYTEGSTIFNCQDYQFRDTGSVLSINLTSRGRCEGENVEAWVFEAVHNCSILTTSLIAGQGTKMYANCP